MTGEDDIVPGARKQLAETKGTLVHEPSKRHLPGYLSGGPRQAQLEAQGLLHLGDREIEQVGDRLGGLAGSELLGNHLGRHRPHHRSPVLIQRIERDQPTEVHWNHRTHLALNVADIPEIADKALHRGGHHRLPAADHHEHLVTGDANLLLNMTNKLAAIDVEKRPGVRERIPAELLAQLDHGRTQPVHRRTASAELGEQPRLHELPPGHFLIARVTPDSSRLGELAGALNNLAVRLWNIRRREEALAHLQETVAIRRRLAETDPESYLPGLARSLNNLAGWFSDLNRHDEAVTLAQESVAIRRRLTETAPGTYLRELGRSLKTLAGCLADSRRDDEALTAAKEGVDIQRRLATTDPDEHLPDLAGSLNNLALQLVETGRPDQAVVTIEEAILLRRRLAKAAPDSEHLNQHFVAGLARSLRSF